MSNPDDTTDVRRANAFVVGGSNYIPNESPYATIRYPAPTLRIADLESKLRALDTLYGTAVAALDSERQQRAAAEREVERMKLVFSAAVTLVADFGNGCFSTDMNHRCDCTCCPLKKAVEAALGEKEAKP